MYRSVLRPNVNCAVLSGARAQAWPGVIDRKKDPVAARVPRCCSRAAPSREKRHPLMRPDLPGMVHTVRSVITYLHTLGTKGPTSSCVVVPSESRTCIRPDLTYARQHPSQAFRFLVAAAVHTMHAWALSLSRARFGTKVDEAADPQCDGTAFSILDCLVLKSYIS